MNSTLRSFSRVHAGEEASAESPPLIPAVSRYGTYKGCPSVSFSEEEVAAFMEPLRFALIGKFDHCRRPALDLIKKALRRFGFKGAVKVGVIDSKHLLIRPVLEEDSLLLRSKDVWFVARAPMCIFKWTPDFSFESNRNRGPERNKFKGAKQQDLTLIETPQELHNEREIRPNKFKGTKQQDLKLIETPQELHNEGEIKSATYLKSDSLTKIHEELEQKISGVSI